MDRDLRDIEELFKAALENEQEMPEPKVWEAIDHILDKDYVVSIQKKYDDLKKVAFLLFFMLVGVGIYELQKQRAEGAYNSSKRVISAEKTNGDGSIEKNKGVSFKIVKPDYLPKKSDRSADRKVVVEDGFGSIKKQERNSLLVGNQKQVKAYKRKTRGEENFARRHLLAYNSSVNPCGVIEKKQREKLANQDIQMNEKRFFKDLNYSFAEKICTLKTDSGDRISLHQTQVLLQVSSSKFEKKSTIQNTKAKSGKPSPFSLNVFFSPDFASYRLKDNVAGNSINEAAKTEKDERHEFSSTTGALIEYTAAKHWSIQSGFAYSNTNITLDPQTIYAKRDNYGSVKYQLNTSSGSGYLLPSFSRSPTIGDSLYAFTSTHTLRHLSLPVSIKYNITKGKFSFNVMTGAAVNFLIQGRVETSVEDGTNNEPEVVNNLQGLKKIYFSGLSGIGMDYNLTKKFAVTFAPTFRFALNAINKGAPIKTYPNSLGIAAGVKFNF